MAQKFLTDIEVTRGLVDSSGDLGVAGQVLSSTGSGTNWITNESSSTVVYLDEFTGDNSTVDFTLSVSVTDENITQVYIDGVYQNKDTYSVSGATLTFSTAPPLNADIEVITFSTATTSDDLAAGSVIIPVKNTHTASIAKGEPVYITGNVGSSARLEIAPADASNSAKMPAAGLLLQTLAVNAEGYVITGGYLRNITTDTIDGTSTSSNDTVYVKSGGGLTMTKPTGTNLIQNIAKVARVASGSAGSLLVSSILRTNDVPNITNDYFWLGNSSGVATATSYTSRFDTAFATKDTDDLTEGSNLYFTTARARSSISAGGDLSYNSTTGVMSYTTPTTIASLSNHDTDDLSEGATNLYYTDTRVGTYLTNNSYATQSYVNTQVSNLVDSAPSTLDTLNELAAALGDDANFSTTVTNSIATKLPLTGGTLTGNVLIGNTVVNPASGFADQTGIGLKYSTTVPEIQISSDDTALQLGRTSTGGHGEVMAIRYASNTIHSFKTNSFDIGTSATFNSGTTNVVATFQSTDGIAAIKLQDPVGNVELSNAGSTFNVQPSGGTSTFIVESNGRIRATDGTRVLYMGAWDGTNNRIEGSSGHNILMTSYNANINLGINGTSEFEIDTAGDINSPDILYMRQTRYGYSPSYRVAQFGNAVATSSISLGYNPSSNTTSGFSGNEILIPNNIRILAPNAADNLFYGVLIFDSNDKLLIGSTNYLIENNYILKLDPANSDIYNKDSSVSHTKYGYNSIDDTIFGGDETTAFGASSLASATAGRNSAFGFRALQDLTTGTYNTAVGGEALENINTGAYNVGVGSFALRITTTSDGNTAMGYTALYNSQNDYNTGFGYRAGYGINDGARNTAIGALTFENGTTTGDDNTAVGHYALNSLGNASQNTAVGAYAGDAITVGASNVAVGYKALSAAQGDSNNVAIGRTAMQLSSGAEQSVAIGNDCLEGATGSYNVAVGTFAGRIVTSGIHNVLVGRNSGYNLTTGEYNTFIGSASGQSTTGGVRNVAIGYAALNGSTGSYNVAVGMETLNNNSLSYNTALGYEAGRDGDGQENTFIGYHAGRLSAGGNECVFVGSAAGYYNNSSDNVGVGRRALYGVSASNSGPYNTAIGQQAGYAITTGSSNAIVGERAGSSINSGSENVIVGSRAAFNLTTGTWNTIIGHQAGYNQTTANYNTFIGRVAGYGQTTGEYNTFLGYYSGHASSSASNNTFLGALTGRFCTSGTQNTFVGSQAADNTTISGDGNTSLGFGSAHNIGDGDNNVCIGRNAGFLVTTGNNNILIGEAAGNNPSNSNSLGIVTTGSNEIQMGNDDHTSAYIQISWTTVSDARDKGNIADIPYGLDFINQLNPKVYEFTNNREENIPDGKQRFGFLAQDVLEIEGDNPIIVNNTDENKLKMTNDYLIPVLVKAIKELKAEIETLKTQING